MTEAKNHLSVVPAASADAAGRIDAPKTEGDLVDWSAVDWDDIVPRLLLLAMSRLSRMTWRGRRNAPPPGASEAEDFVNDAIAKTMAGVRVWSKANCTLFQHLAGIIVSDISHAATAAENRLTLADDGQTAHDQTGDEEGWPPDQADERPGQEDQVLWRSEQRRLLGYLDQIDPKLGQMAELMLLEDIDGSAELATRLQCSVSDIANLRKRMKRVVQAFLALDEDSLP